MIIQKFNQGWMVQPQSDQERQALGFLFAALTTSTEFKDQEHAWEAGFLECLRRHRKNPRVPPGLQETDAEKLTRLLDERVNAAHLGAERRPTTVAEAREQMGEPDWPRVEDLIRVSRWWSPTKPIFEITEGDKRYSIFLNGRTTGFGPHHGINNGFISLVHSLLAHIALQADQLSSFQAAPSSEPDLNESSGVTTGSLQGTPE